MFGPASHFSAKKMKNNNSHRRHLVERMSSKFLYNETLTISVDDGEPSPKKLPRYFYFRIV